MLESLKSVVEKEEFKDVSGRKACSFKTRCRLAFLRFNELKKAARERKLKLFVLREKLSYGVYSGDSIKLMDKAREVPKRGRKG